MSGNRLLHKLSPPLRTALLAEAKERDWPHGSALYEQGAPMAEVHFPVSGVYSVILHMEDGQQVEALTVGTEGMLGTAAVLAGNRSPFDTIAQIPGSTLTLPAETVRRAIATDPELDHLLRLYMLYEQRHLHQSAACNALHHVEQRLSRWLLMSHDRVDGDSLPLTQEFLAAMLGIRRQSVGQVAHDLQRKGLIHYSRGMVVIADRDGLEAHCCECYVTVRTFYDEVVAPPLPRD